jgi:Skp family chaperone for outer membrane proteins
MIYRVFASAAVCASALALALAGGCDKKPSADAAATQPVARPPEVGMVDLKQVEEDLGYLRELTTNLDVLKQELQSDLQARQSQLQTNLQAEAQRLGIKEGAQLSPQQSQAFSKLVQERQVLMNQLDQIARELYSKYQAEWLRRYREALIPVAKEVGFAKKVKLVIERGDYILHYDAAIDLTAAVTEAAREKQPVVAAPQRPRLPTLNENPTAAPATAPTITIPSPPGGGVGGGGAPATAPATRSAPATAPAPASKK